MALSAGIPKADGVRSPKKKSREGLRGQGKQF